MPKSDWDYFNCSQDHEVKYVVSLYLISEQKDVEKWIIKNCNNGTINNWTHKRLYDALKKAGFTKIR